MKAVFSPAEGTSNARCVNDSSSSDVGGSSKSSITNSSSSGDVSACMLSKSESNISDANDLISLASSLSPSSDFIQREKSSSSKNEVKKASSKNVKQSVERSVERSVNKAGETDMAKETKKVIIGSDMANTDKLAHDLIASIKPNKTDLIIRTKGRGRILLRAQY